jgi:hypothetical protein
MLIDEPCDFLIRGRFLTNVPVLQEIVDLLPDRARCGRLLVTRAPGAKPERAVLGGQQFLFGHLVRLCERQHVSITEPAPAGFGVVHRHAARADDRGGLRDAEAGVAAQELQVWWTVVGEKDIERLTERRCNRGELLAFGEVLAALPSRDCGGADAHHLGQFLLVEVLAPPDSTYAAAVELTWGHMNSCRVAIGPVGASSRATVTQA